MIDPEGVNMDDVYQSWQLGTQEGLAEIAEGPPGAAFTPDQPPPVGRYVLAAEMASILQHLRDQAALNAELARRVTGQSYLLELWRERAIRQQQRADEEREKRHHWMRRALTGRRWT